MAVFLRIKFIYGEMRMSYCRFSNGLTTYMGGTKHAFTPEKSDVYVYESFLGFLDCCGCILDDGYWQTTSRQEMIDHLLEHREAGHTVPQFAIDRLREEIKKEGDEIEEWDGEET